MRNAFDTYSKCFYVVKCNRIVHATTHVQMVVCVRVRARARLVRCVLHTSNTDHTWKPSFEKGVIYCDPICIEMFSPIKWNLRFTARPEIYNIHKCIFTQYIFRRDTQTHPYAHHNTSHIKYKVSYVFVPYTRIETIFPKYFIDSVVYRIYLIIPCKHHHKVGKQISSDKIAPHTHTHILNSKYKRVGTSCER